MPTRARGGTTSTSTRQPGELYTRNAPPGARGRSPAGSVAVAIAMASPRDRDGHPSLALGQRATLEATCRFLGWRRADVGCTRGDNTTNLYQRTRQQRLDHGHPVRRHGVGDARALGAIEPLVHAAARDLLVCASPSCARDTTARPITARAATPRASSRAAPRATPCCAASRRGWAWPRARASRAPCPSACARRRAWPRSPRRWRWPRVRGRRCRSRPRRGGGDGQRRAPRRRARRVCARRGRPWRRARGRAPALLRAHRKAGRRGGRPRARRRRRAT